MSASTSDYDTERPQVGKNHKRSYEGPTSYVRGLLEYMVMEEMQEFIIDVEREQSDKTEQEIQENKYELVNEIVSHMVDNFLGTLPYIIGNDTISFYDMTLCEIIAKLKCRCNAIKNNEYVEEDDTEFMVGPVDVLWENDSNSETDSFIFDELAKSHESLNVIQCKDLRQFAEEFVLTIIEEAEAVCMENNNEKYKYLDAARSDWVPKENVEFSVQPSDSQSAHSSSDNEEEDQSVYEIPNLTIGAFKPDCGKSLIHHYIKSWRLTKDWKYWIEYTAFRIDVFHDFYEYEVKWSLPTNDYPVPQVTVIVLFIIKVSRVSPPTCPVKVGYYFEGSAIQFKMTDQIHHEKYLNDSLAHKQKFSSQMHF